MYAYLTSSIIFGLIWLILYINRKDLRREILFSSFLFLPFGLTQALFVPDYWNPIVIYKFLGLFDIESLLHTFFLGGIAASLYEEIFNYHLRKQSRGKSPRRYSYIIYFVLVLCAACMVAIKLFSSVSVLWAWALFVACVAPYFLFSRKDLILPSFIGGISFMALYSAVLIFIDFAFGGFVVREWNMFGLHGAFFLGLPIEEYVYSFLLGMGWSVIYEEIQNVCVV